MISSGSSIQNFGGYFGGVFAPLASGFIADTTGSYSLAFGVPELIVLLGAISYLWIVGKPIEEKGKLAKA